MELGKLNTLIIDRNTTAGLFLVDNDDNDVLLPGKYMPESFEIGDSLEVFVYLDNEERIIATTMKPKIQLHQFALLRVNQVTKYGAFLDMGIEKDLFVPFKEQVTPMHEGRDYLVYMYLDEKTDRLVGSSRLNKFLSNQHLTVEEMEEVDLVVSHASDSGINVIINGLHRGLIYHNQVFKKLYVGDQLIGTISKVREGNKIDVVLQQPGHLSIEPNAAIILEKLKENNGFLGLTDKSHPELIKKVLQMSKKSFKKALGNLYKQRKVLLKADGIYLIP